MSQRDLEPLSQNRSCYDTEGRVSYAKLARAELVREGVEVTHILGDGSLESHEHALQRLAVSLKLGAGDLFSNSADLVEEAYDLQAARSAYVKKDAGKKER